MAADYNHSTDAEKKGMVLALGDAENGMDDEIIRASSDNGRLASLLRLFNSDFFNMAMALIYLHKYSDEDIQSYLCNEMKTFAIYDVEFYLPQLIELYVNLPDHYDILKQFIVERCQSSLHFSLVTTWLLRTEMETRLSSVKHVLILQFLEAILQAPPLFPVKAVDARPVIMEAAVVPAGIFVSSAQSISTPRANHRRTKSDVTSPSAASPPSKLFSTPPRPVRSRVTLGGTPDRHSLARSSTGMDLSHSMSSGNLSDLALDTGRAFEWPLFKSSSQPSLDTKDNGREFATNGALNLDQCMQPEVTFVQALIGICHRLVRFPTKDIRRTQLYAELALLNLNLPARVFLPLTTGSGITLGSQTGKEQAKQLSPDKVHLKEHHIVRIPPQEAVTLNSKEKVPYMIQVEVVDCQSCQTSPIPSKWTRHLSKRPVHEKRPVFGMEAAAETQEAEQEGCVRPQEIRRRLKEAIRHKHMKYQQNHADPSAKAFKEPWAEKVERIRRHSPFGHLPRWRLVPVIVKGGDDLRQELLASQLLYLFQQTWMEERVSVWVRPMRILVTGSEGGLLEVCGSAVSIHQAKQTTGGSLLAYFREEFGSHSSENFLKARQNFAESLAAYSLFCYFVQVKDRHNGNILIDGEGHILHIDFGFIMSNSPGRNLGFESAPFKLTEEFIEVLGGIDSDMFRYFKNLLLQGFMAARKHMDRFVTVVEIMQKDSQLPCFVGKDSVKHFSDRFQLGLTEQQLVDHVENLIAQSVANLSTTLYDKFQYLTNGIM